MSILFPTDFSANSAKAFEYAYYFGKTLREPITLLHIFPAPMPTVNVEESGWQDMSVEVMAISEKAATERLHQFKADLREKYSREYGESIRVDEMIRMGFTGEEIIHAAEALNAPYIIMAVTHTSNFKRVLFGSSTAHVLKKSKIPVITIPENTKFSEIRKIAYATDLTYNDHAIIARLLSLADKLGAEVRCFHVHDSNLTIENAIIKDLMTQYESEVKKGIISFQIIDNITILDGIDYFIREYDIDLLAMLSQKKYWLDMFEKSMTKQMAFHSKVPLLIYHE